MTYTDREKLLDKCEKLISRFGGRGNLSEGSLHYIIERLLDIIQEPNREKEILKELLGGEE